MEIRSWLPPWIRPRPAGDPPADEDAIGDARSRDGSAPTEPAAPPVGRPVPQEDAAAELRTRRDEIVRMEERALRQMESVETQLRELDRRRESLDDRERTLDVRTDELRDVKQRQLRELER